MPARAGGRGPLRGRRLGRTAAWRPGGGGRREHAASRRPFRKHRGARPPSKEATAAAGRGGPAAPEGRQDDDDDDGASRAAGGVDPRSLASPRSLRPRDRSARLALVPEEPDAEGRDDVPAPTSGAASPGRSPREGGAAADADQDERGDGAPPDVHWFDRLVATIGDAACPFAVDGDDGTTRSDPTPYSSPAPAPAPLLSAAKRAASFPPSARESFPPSARRGRAYLRRVGRRRSAARASRSSAAAGVTPEGARARAEDEARRAEEASEARVRTCAEELERTKAKLSRETRQNGDLHAEVTRLKRDVVAAKARLKRDASEGGVAALRARIEAKIEAGIAEGRRLRDEEVRLLRAECRRTARDRDEDVGRMDGVVRGLRRDFEVERRRREEAEGVARERAEETERLRGARPAALETMEAELKVRRIRNEALTSKAAELKTKIRSTEAERRSLKEINARLAKEAEKAREDATAKIDAQAEALRQMEAKWRSEQKIREQTKVLAEMEAELKDKSERNAALAARIEQMNASALAARLREEAATAEAARRSAERDGDRAADEARSVREEAVAGAGDRARALAEALANWKSETLRTDALTREISRLEEDVAAAAGLAESDQREKPTVIIAQAGEWERIGQTVKKLKADLAQKYKLRDEAFESSAGAEADLEKIVDLKNVHFICEDAIASQKQYIERLKVAQSASWSAPSSSAVLREASSSASKQTSDTSSSDTVGETSEGDWTAASASSEEERSHGDGIADWFRDLSQNFALFQSNDGESFSVQ